MNDFNFLLNPLIAGLAITIIAGPLGVFMIWRRMAFVGDTIAHSSLLGVSLALWWECSPLLGICFVGVLIALLIVQDDQGKIFGTDAILGLISQSSLALGIIISTAVVPFRVDLLGYLYGDILSVSDTETMWTLGFNIALLVLLFFYWRSLVAVSLQKQLAIVSGINVKWINFLYLISLAITIGLGMRLVGVLLITALLIIPAATGRFFAKTPEQMAITSVVFGMIAVSLGLWFSLILDWPSGPTIVVVAIVLWILTALIHSIVQKRKFSC